MRQEPVIVTNGLSRWFGATTAVADMTIEVQAGEVFGLLGHNGAGKTTTIRLLTGVLKPSGGTAFVLGRSPLTDGPEVRARTGVLTETPALDERLTGRENLSIFAHLYRVAPQEVEKRVDDMLTIFGLTDRANSRVAEYSKGMKQRLALARTMIHHPDLLFLDEPTAGLDPVAARHVQDMIQERRQAGHTVVLCTHNLAEAHQLCDRVAVLETGRIVALGEPRLLAQQIGWRQQVELEISEDAVPTALVRIGNAFPNASASVEVPGIITLEGLDREDIPTLLAVLIQSEVAIYRVAPHEASLEDVYFALHGKVANR